MMDLYTRLSKVSLLLTLLLQRLNREKSDCFGGGSGISGDQATPFHKPRTSPLITLTDGEHGTRTMTA